jgi:hypothetical protein
MRVEEVAAGLDAAQVVDAVVGGAEVGRERGEVEPEEGSEEEEPDAGGGARIRHAASILEFS